MSEGSTNPFAPQPGQEQIEYLRIGFGQRLIAYIIDVLGLVIFTTMLVMLFMNFDLPPTESIKATMDSIRDIYALLGVPESMSEMVIGKLPALTIASVIGALSYSLIEGLSGASPGKMVMKFRIANQDGTAGSTSLFLRRWAIKNIGAILQFIAFVPSLMFMETIGSFAGFVIFFGCFAVLGESRLTLHDRIAQTAVYHQNDVKQ